MWLEPLSEAQYDNRDLVRFGVASNTNEDKNLRFSIIRRPTPYSLSPSMCLVDWEKRESDWDEVMFHLARWLTRHLGDPELIQWLSKNGGQLHERFAALVQHKIEQLVKHETEGKIDELDRIRSDAPNAIPSSLMRKFWRILITGRLKSHLRFDLYEWFSRIKSEGVTPLLRMELRKLLTPCVILRPPFNWGESIPTESERFKDLLDWELVLSSDNVHSTLRDRSKIQKWQSALPSLLQDFTMLLRDALDLKMELGGADERNDMSYIHQPSISEHPQNLNLHDWTALIQLTRDAWLATVQTDFSGARHAAEGWWRTPYPLFKRLALFAAAQGQVISQRQALDWLLDEGCWWLWTVETQRETSRLLVNLAPRLTSSEMTELEQAILNGPPREMFRDDIDQEEFARTVDRAIYLYLEKIQTAGAILGKAASSKLNELAQQFPGRRSTEDERDEFPFWMGGDGEGRKISRSPRRGTELVKWLKKNACNDRDQDDWRQRCRDDFPNTAYALCALSKEGIWLEVRWRYALQAWSEDNLLERSWRRMSSVLNDAPDEIIESLANSLSWWLQVLAKKFESKEKFFLNLCRRVLASNYSYYETDDPVGDAINHPVGHVTDALLKWWYRRSLNDGEGLPNEIKAIFTECCNTQIDKFRHSRVLLATNVIPLYRADPDWAAEYLLPLFDWQRSSIEARSAWEGFLWSPRLFRPFLSDIKIAFLETAKRYAELGKHASRYADFLTFAALDPGDTFTNQELAKATLNLPLEGLESVAKTLTRALEGALNQRNEYWSNRLLPYFKNIWPKSRELITPTISKSFAHLCVAAGDIFPEVFLYLKHWLQQVQYPSHLVHLLYTAKICEQFPDDALSFLDAIIGDDTQSLPRELQQCLDAIEQADSQLANNTRFSRLAELFRRIGMD
jgi:hypothetical protein